MATKRRPQGKKGRKKTMARKESKKAIYAKHGITFENDHILYNGKWIKPLLKEGNDKVGRTVWTFSLPAGTAGSCICDCKGCYAKTGRYTCANVIESNRLNMEIVDNDIGFFYRAISAQLETIGSGKVRIHASGDFNTRDPEMYAETWKRIAKENPSFLFWTYTKMERFEGLFDGIDNGNIVKSVINGIGINYGHCDYIIESYKKLVATGADVYICRCGIDENQHCENCTHCATAEFVLFIEHSTKYNAKKDPRYSELVELIESQAA